MKLLADPRVLDERRQFTLFDDFDKFDAVERWTLTADAGATGLQDIDPDGVGGIMVLTCDGDDNDEAYIETKELFKFAADKPLVYETRVQYAEADVDDANILIGMLDAPGADSLVDDGGGPKASYSGAVFFKVDGGTKWVLETSIGSAQTTTTLEDTAGGASFHTLRIEVLPVSATVCDVIPYIDTAGGQDFKQCRDANGNLVKHQVLVASATEMAAAFGVKAGGAAEEALSIDYVAVSQLR